MSIQNKATYTAQKNSDFANNVSGLITPTIQRADRENLKDSVAFLSDANTYTAQQRWAKGADLASKAALGVDTSGNYFDVTGVAAITSFDDSGGAGAIIMLQFDAACTLTHHATDLILPAGANITTALGDHAIFCNYATGDYRLVAYQRADGTSLVGGNGSTGLINKVNVSDGSGGFSDTNVTLSGSTFTDSGLLVISGLGGLRLVSNDAILLDSRMIPSTGSATDLGSSAAAFQKLFIDDIQLGDTTTTGTSRGIEAVGTETNIDVLVTPKGTGTLVTSAGHTTNISADDDVITKGYADTNYGAVSATVYDYLYIDAAAMVPSTTNGAQAGSRELATNDVMIDYLAFDTATDEYAQFKWKPPEQIVSNAVIRFKFDMATETGAATTLIFGMQFIIMSSDESLDQAWSTATVAGAVTMTTTNDIYMSDGACTATLTGIAAGDTVFFRVFRDVSADTHAIDGQLLGVHMQIPVNNTATSVWS